MDENHSTCTMRYWDAGVYNPDYVRIRELTAEIKERQEELTALRQRVLDECLMPLPLRAIRDGDVVVIHGPGTPRNERRGLI